MYECMYTYMKIGTYWENKIFKKGEFCLKPKEMLSPKKVFFVLQIE